MASFKNTISTLMQLSRTAPCLLWRSGTHIFYISLLLLSLFFLGVNCSKSYFQEGSHGHNKLEAKEAFTKALRTWAQWADANIDRNRTRVFFGGYSTSHLRKGQWDTRGHFHNETEPMANETSLAPYPWMMIILESVIAEMKTPVFYLNITKMTAYRKDGHLSIYRPQEILRTPDMFQDCSHWCLHGVPDYWNELLYATLLI